MKEEESQYLAIIDKILAGLAKVRMGQKGWIDAETEDTAKETQVFKIGECLRPFYMAARVLGERYDRLPLSTELLARDTDFFLKTVAKNGFFPSPYSYISGAKDQYTDFAAFVVDMCALMENFWAPHKSAACRNRVGAATNLRDRAVQFLLEPQNHLDDAEGCRWGGTSRYVLTTKSKVKTYYTNTYFTAVVVLALGNILEQGGPALDKSRMETLRSTIRRAGKWIVGRFDGAYITGDEAKTNRALIHTTWALRALAQTLPHQDETTKRLLPSMVEPYLNAVRTGLEDGTLAGRQEYLTILSEDVDAPLYYDDRSGLGGILLSLLSFSGIVEIEALLDQLGYGLLLERLTSAILNSRNPTTGLWFNQSLILSAHSYLTETFLLLNQKRDEIGRKVSVSGPIIRDAVRAVFEDKTVLSNLQQAVYEQVLRIVEQGEQGSRLAAELSKLKPEKRARRQVESKKRQDA